MSLNKEELQQRISAWDVVLPEDENIDWTNEALIKACADKYMQAHPELDTWGQRFAWSLQTVMLAKHMKDELKNFDIPPIESDDYVAEFKENGMRVLITYDPLKKGFELLTRKESDVTCLNGNITNKVLFISQGFVSEPKQWAGKFPYRFVLDGEVLADGDTILDGVEYGVNAVEDYIQSIFSANEEKAKEIQKAGHNMSFHVFDVLYFQKDNLEEYPVMKYQYAEEVVTAEDEKWIESYFKDYLESAGFTGTRNGKKKAKPKKLYAYLKSLRHMPRYSVMHYPFIRRRKLRRQLVEMLQKAKLPFVEVDGRDDAKITYLEEVLQSGGEGCFCDSSRVTMADGSYKEIKDISVGEYVLSYNTSLDKLEPKKVLNVFNNGLKKNTEWYSVSHGVLQGKVPNRMNHNRRIICTKTHEFYNGHNNFTPISELDCCYELDYILDDYRKQALLGWLLSDGCIDKKNLVRLNQKYDSPYWAFTLQLFNNFIDSGDKWSISGKGSKIGKASILKRYTYNIFRRPENYSFIDFISQMNEIGLAYMIMGDGSGNKKGLRLGVYSYSEDEVNKIVEQINTIVGEELHHSLYRDSRVKSGSGLLIRYWVESTQKIFEKVGKYIHPSMRYKITNVEQQNMEYIGPPEVEKGLVKSNILKKDLSTYKNTPPHCETRAWDIEVEDNHNYFVENVLVHNCILKEIHAPYIAGLRSSRTHRACLKVKQSISQLMDGQKMYEDFDVFITGANPPKSKRMQGMIGSLSCSIYMINDAGEQVVHEIANVSGLTHEWKRELAVIGEDGKVKLNPKYLNKVIAVDGMALSGTSLKFHHAVLKNKETLEFKAKNPTDCCWDIDTLRDMVLTRGK